MSDSGLFNKDRKGKENKKENTIKSMNSDALTL